jgi:hypothetical protein
VVYHCLNPFCTNPNPTKLFVHPAKICTQTKNAPTNFTASTTIEVLEVYCCPHCHTINYEEHKPEATPPQQQVETQQQVMEVADPHE